MDDRILSTSNDIVGLIRSGKAVQSPFSEAFIKAVKRELDMDIVACYVQTGECNTFRGGKPTDDFVDEVFVTLYAREASLQIAQAREGFDAEIESIFWNTVQSLGLHLSYKRVYSPEELTYYGFAQRPRCEWDMDKIRKPVLPLRRSVAVKIENLDRLALYQLLSDTAKSVGNYIRQDYECNAKVYVGFLKTPPYIPTHYIVFDTQKEYEHFLSRVCLDTIIADIQEGLQAYDRWSVLDTWHYCPEYRLWHQLSGEDKMCLLRETHG